MQTKGQFRKQINLSDLSPGTYIIMVQTANEISTQKISIVR
ncbi:MAG: T9SS type A sorting domain-containing protein [Bacteroidetes bacterium]|nr:T9SS type A sorting domain-containing protein [Bacteroidota bacterium]